MIVNHYPDPFDAAQVDAVIRRIMSLSPDTTPQWGRMNVAQMLAHLSVAYEMVYTDKHRKPSALLRFVLRRIVKPRVVGPAPYPHGAPTAPQFRIPDGRDFEVERDQLISWIRRAHADGRDYFEGHVSPSFGPLTAHEWAVLFGKHLDHHLTQFGV
jgi:hypothetical protein